MIIPDFLQEGDTISIISPSGPIKADSLDFAIESIKSWGLSVILGKHTYNKYSVFAGTDNNRQQDFQETIDDKNIKAIICARGGYGSIRIVNNINYSNFQQHPSWIVGFSDITVFHSKLHSLGIASIHGAMAKSFPSITEQSLQSLHDTLFGISKPILSHSSLSNRCGICHGQLIGGNLSILYSMRGIDFEYDYTDKILFIEDLNEYLYHIDRMMQNFKLSGILGKISGLIIGTMSGMKNGIDEFGASAESIILDAVKEYNYPVVFGFPSGHENLNQAMIFGGNYTLNVSENDAILTKDDII